MTVHRYLIARFPEKPRPVPVPRALWHEANDAAEWYAEVLARSVAHARRLVLEGAEALQGIDGRIERCGIIYEHGQR